jgi:hypothetical protein
MKSSSFADVLHTSSPAPDLADKLALYAFILGAWDTKVIAHEENGATHESSGEIHAGWVLEGRGIQDVWMIPARPERRPGMPVLPVAGNWYGTTLRIYDPRIDAWQIFWNDPANSNFVRQIARAEGSDVVQIGTTETGAVWRWTFTDIRGDGFHWFGEESKDEGRTWRKLADVFARRAQG